jgi:hypothetical protein
VGVGTGFDFDFDFDFEFQILVRGTVDVNQSNGLARRS